MGGPARRTSMSGSLTHSHTRTGEAANEQRASGGSRRKEAPAENGARAAAVGVLRLKKKKKNQPKMKQVSDAAALLSSVSTGPDGSSVWDRRGGCFPPGFHVRRRPAKKAAHV